MNILKKIDDFFDKHDRLRKEWFNIIHDKDEFFKQIKIRCDKLEEWNSFKIRIRDGVRELQKIKGKIIIHKVYHQQDENLL